MPAPLPFASLQFARSVLLAIASRLAAVGRTSGNPGSHRTRTLTMHRLLARGRGQLGWVSRPTSRRSIDAGEASTAEPIAAATVSCAHNPVAEQILFEGGGVIPANQTANLAQGAKQSADEALSRVGAVENRMVNLERKVDAVERKVSAGVAMAMAMEVNQPTLFAPNSRNALTLGSAAYNGQTALGGQYSRLLESGGPVQVVISVGVAISSDGQRAIRSGASFRW